MPKMTPLLYLAGGMGVLAMISGGFAAIQTARLKTEKTISEHRAGTITTLETSIEQIQEANARERAAELARNEAGETLRRELEARAGRAERDLTQARRIDAKLDECLRTDFGVDLSFGVLEFAAGDNGPTN